jgi:hypothetical protein
MRLRDSSDSGDYHYQAGIKDANEDNKENPSDGAKADLQSA